MKKNILIFFILYSTLILSETRYVSKTGASMPPYTTWETACDSIQKCINICNSGDTIYIDRGIYREILDVRNKDVNLIGIDADECIINGTGLIGSYSQYVMCYFFRSNTKLENFTFVFDAYDDYPYYQALMFFNGVGIVRNCIFESIAICLSFNIGGQVANSILNGGSIPIFITDSNNALYEVNNSIFSFSNYQMSYYGIYNLAGGGEFKIYNNIMFTSNTSTSSYPIKLLTDSKIEINNNLFWGYKYGINCTNYQNTLTDTTYIKNNIFSNFGGYCIITGNQPKEYEIENNIFAKSKKGIYTYGYVSKSDYNLFYNIQENLYTNMQKGEHDFVADPMFVNDTAAVLGGTYNYKLQKYSPAIDAGDPNILDIDGSRSDIGMYGGPLGIKYTYQDLAPKLVTGLTGEYEEGSNVVKLSWAKNTAADFKNYKIYKDINPNFTIDSTKLISETNNNSFNDSLSKGSQKVYYKVTAIDSTGNESIPSAEVNVTITNINDAEIKLNYNYELYQNYPNPFNPATTISYSLKEPGDVRVKLYNITGQLLQTLIEGEKDKGYNETKIDLSNYASGIYLYRLEVTGKGKIPVFNDLKKMVYVK